MIVFFITLIQNLLLKPIKMLFNYFSNKYFNIKYYNIENVKIDSNLSFNDININIYKRHLLVDKILYKTSLDFLLLPKSKFIIWKNCHLLDVNIIEKLRNDYLLKITIFEILLKKFIINLGLFEITIKGLSIDKNKNTVTIKIKKISVCYCRKYLAKITNFTNVVNVKYSKFDIEVDCVRVNLTEKMIHEKLFDNIFIILSKIPKNQSNFVCNYHVKNIILNLEVQNLVKFVLGNIKINKDYVNIKSINGKVWKKDVFWLNDLTIDKTRKTDPSIYSIRFRLFKSTGSKLHKTFSIIYKHIVPYVSKSNVTSEPVLCHTTSIIYIGNIPIINDFITIKTDIILKIFNLEFLIEPFKYQLILKDIQYEKNASEYFVNIDNWSLLDDKDYLIKKIKSYDDKFVIKYANQCLEIYPYKTYIDIDIEKYCLIFGNVYDLFNSIHKSFNTRTHSESNQEYIFKKIHIQSFSSIFSYSKNQFSYDKLINEGRYSELINIYSFRDILLVFKNIDIYKPKNSSDIFNILIKNLVKSLTGRNLKNIIKNTPAKPLVTIYNIKKNVLYYGNKINNLANDKFNKK